MQDGMLMAEKVQSKRRSDYGQVVLNKRDIDIMMWVGEQFAIRFDHLQLLAGQLSNVPSAVSETGLSYKATYRITTRWVKAGLVVRKRIFMEEPLWLWLTPKGIRTVGLDVDSRPPAISRLAHIHAVNAVRIHVERRVKDQARWIGEREANALRRNDDKKRHLVDGEVEYRDGVVAGVEVELTQKRAARLNNILRELKREYDSVWYFAAPECYNAVKNAIERVTGHEETFILHRLSPIMNIGV